MVGTLEMYLSCKIRSELGFAGGAGEGDDVTDVGHTCDEEHKTLVLRNLSITNWV